VAPLCSVFLCVCSEIILCVLARAALLLGRCWVAWCRRSAARLCLICMLSRSPVCSCHAVDSLVHHT
jgi:hypothetical protein